MKKQTTTDKVLKLKERNPQMRNFEIADKLGISASHVANALWHLRKTGRLGPQVGYVDGPATYDAPAPAVTTPSANSVQIGGDHYKSKAIQPWDFIASNNMGFLAGNVVKYLSRYKEKGGVADLEKARHYLDKLIETERG